MLVQLIISEIVTIRNFDITRMYARAVCVYVSECVCVCVYACVHMLRVRVRVYVPECACVCAKCGRKSDYYLTRH